MAKDAIIFDFDGTLVDSIGFHFRIHQKVFERAGIKLTERFFFNECNGMEPHEFYEKILKYHGKDISVMGKVWKDMLREKRRQGLDSIKAYPGVKGMLNHLQKRDIRMLIASSSRHAYVMEILKNNGIEGYFHKVVGSDGIEHSKPHPAIFLKAWEHSGTDKGRCVVLEDSINGVKAARRAHMDAICLTTTTSIEDIPESAFIAESHSEVPHIIQRM